MFDHKTNPYSKSIMPLIVSALVLWVINFFIVPNFPDTPSIILFLLSAGEIFCFVLAAINFFRSCYIGIINCIVNSDGKIDALTHKVDVLSKKVDDLRNDIDCLEDFPDPYDKKPVYVASPADQEESLRQR